MIRFAFVAALVIAAAPALAQPAQNAAPPKMPDSPYAGAPWPAQGHVFAFTNGTMHYSADGKQMTFETLFGPDKGTSLTVDVTVMPIRPDVFLVSWQEPSGRVVVHVEDYKNMLVYSTFNEPDGRVFRFRAPIKKLE
jgi:MoaF-like